MMSATARGASAEEPDPRWSPLRDHVVVVERQDGSRVEGKLVEIEPGSVEVQKADGGRAFIQRSVIKALRTKLRGRQVTVSMKENDETISGKLVEKDEETIVVEKDDGERVTIERASIKVTLERAPTASAVAPRAVSSGKSADSSGSSSSDGGSSALEGIDTWDDRPSNGRGLFIAGGVFLGIGLGNLITSPICKTDRALNPDTQDLCLKVALGVGGASAGLGLALILGGVHQRQTYDAWKRQHFGFVPERGGGTLTWQRAF
jgi:small nuclear ribonucleoprotein (snRNP)-like protein